ncbi:zinc-dependent alcohol dehydrogenase family protein [Fervidibacillus halotolerans]|uniref:Zinc-dependent alcohol dehydrogenase family protein n=1 Tax=Fervidibacillus halotolerans TaxID=2980027 RepID=A0A9E8RYZ7_9BACI|nr:zinc-dependent alcohol dehydrogenase family protein [Fervidibacillus halotolerans]WAA12674.1 zinc-dependent alcohol dehydrogenase family protein [Fervidibacillus halotolerans]
MKAAIFHGLEDIRVEEKEIRPLKENELLIRVKACGICGTDIHIYHGEQGSAPVTPPVILGHEYAGEVVEIGPGVKDFSVGDYITVDPNMFCGTCEYCRSDKPYLCNHLTALGVNLDGGFAEYSIVPTTQAYKFPKHVSFEEAALTEPLACSLHGSDLAEIKPGDKVAIIGAGAIGLMMTQLAKISGASYILVSEFSKERRELALELGADAAVHPVEEKIDENAFDVVIECAGKIVAMESAIKIAKKGATIVLFSVPSPNAELKVKPFEIFQKELTIKGSFINPFTQKRALDLIASGKVQVKPLISHEFSIDNIHKGLEMQRNPEAIKVVVKP